MRTCSFRGVCRPMWRLFVAAILLAGLADAASVKKGVGTWYFSGGSKAMNDLNPSWYYTWRVDNKWEPAPSGCRFIPMIWDETHVNSSELSAAKSTGAGILLGFNEPDHGSQANMSVTQALDLWPQLEATGMRLGSPAMAGNPSNSGSWLEKFMAGAATKGYRVDFICVHWYGKGSDATTETTNLKNFLAAAYNKFKKPLWLTEYALVNWYSSPRFPSYDQEAAFAAKSIAMLESLSFVERYAWFALPPWKDGTISATTNLYTESGSPTAVGIAYRDAGGGTVQLPPAPTLKLPSNSATGVAINPTLSWGTVTGATSYRLQVSTSSAFSSTAVDKSGLTAASYKLAGLQAKTTYYWRVNASGPNGTGNWSTTWKFTTAQPTRVEMPGRFAATSCARGSADFTMDVSGRRGRSGRGVSLRVNPRLQRALVLSIVD